MKKNLRGVIRLDKDCLPDRFAAAAIERGADVEMEHTSDRETARVIACDHLAEDPQYYERLATIEGGDQRRLAWKKSSGRRPGDDPDLHRVEETTLGDRTIVIYGYSLGPKLRNFEDEHYAIRVVERMGDYRTTHEQELHFAQGFRTIDAAEGAAERWLDAHPA